MNSSLYLVEREIDRLTELNRNQEETIKLLQDEIRILREEKEGLVVDRDFLNDRLSHAYRNHEYTLLQMSWAWVLAFISTGLLAWNF